MLKWAYRLSDQRFLYGGAMEIAVDPATAGIVDLTRNPNARMERYDGSGGIRPATLDEIASYDAESSQERASSRFDQEQVVKAVAIYFAQQMNIPLATARDGILAILRGLG